MYSTKYNSYPKNKQDNNPEYVRINKLKCTLIKYLNIFYLQIIKILIKTRIKIRKRYKVYINTKKIGES